jgi:hypothetical protein
MFVVSVNQYLNSEIRFRLHDSHALHNSTIHTHILKGVEKQRKLSSIKSKFLTNARLQTENIPMSWECKKRFQSSVNENLYFCNLHSHIVNFILRNIFSKFLLSKKIPWKYFLGIYQINIKIWKLYVDISIQLSHVIVWKKMRVFVVCAVQRFFQLRIIKQHT